MSFYWIAWAHSFVARQRQDASVPTLASVYLANEIYSRLNTFPAFIIYHMTTFDNLDKMSHQLV